MLPELEHEHSLAHRRPVVGIIDVASAVQVLVSLQLYLLSPYVRRYLRQAAPAAYVVLTVLMPLAAMALMAPLSLVLMFAFSAAVLFVSLLCPFWLVRIHKFKAKINGPWDEAVPELLSTLDDLRG